MRVFVGKQFLNDLLIDGHFVQDVGGRLVHVQQRHLEGSLLAEHDPAEHVDRDVRHYGLDQHGVQAQVSLAIDVDKHLVFLGEDLVEQVFERIAFQSVQRHCVAELLRDFFVLHRVVLKAHTWTDGGVRDTLTRDTRFDLDVDSVTQMVHVQSP
ncbi:hypothetical protein D3C81_998540 [compost metagenome]